MSASESAPPLVRARPRWARSLLRRLGLSVRGRPDVPVRASENFRIPGVSAFMRAHADSKHLVVALSPTGQYSFYRHRFEHDVLYLADVKQNYYVEQIIPLAASVIGLIERSAYEKAIFVGSSKAGFGALLLARTCAYLRPDLNFCALAFSPQTSLHPYNPKLQFSSYERLMRRAESNARLSRALAEFGDVADAGKLPNLYANIVYARGSERDRDEALRVRGPNVRYHVVEGEAHGTAFQFVSKNKTPADIAAKIRRTYLDADDEDLAETRPKDLDAFIEEMIRAAASQPTLNELIDGVLERAPPSRR